MSVTKPFTFVAGTKARANEVNQNFDVLYSQVNSNISAINTNANDIDTLDSNKANVNGSSSQRFACADPTSPSDAVNKQSMMKAINNSINYIDGYTISADSGSPNDTILVTAGSCYDYTKSVVLAKNTSTTKQNTSQGASTTYYVYVIGNDSGSSVDILISSNAVTPALPEGYTKFRQIGSYTTNISGNINNIKSGSSDDIHVIQTYVNGSSWYRVWSDGWIEQGFTSQNLYWSDNDYKEFGWLKFFNSGDYTCIAVSNLGFVNAGVSSGDIGVEMTTNDRIGIGNGASNTFAVRVYACGY